MINYNFMRILIFISFFFPTFFNSQVNTDIKNQPSIQKLSDVNVSSYVNDNVKVINITKAFGKNWNKYEKTIINSSGDMCIIYLKGTDGLVKRALASLINGKIIHYFGEDEKAFFYNDNVYVIRENGLFEFTNKEYVGRITNVDLSKYNAFKKFGQYVVIYDTNLILKEDDLRPERDRKLFQHAIINLNTLKIDIHKFSLENWKARNLKYDEWLYMSVEASNNSNKSLIEKISCFLALAQRTLIDDRILIDTRLLDNNPFEMIIQKPSYNSNVQFYWISFNKDGTATINGDVVIDSDIGSFAGNAGGLHNVILKNKILNVINEKSGVGNDHYKIKLNIDEMKQEKRGLPYVPLLKSKPIKNNSLRMSDFGNKSNLGSDKKWKILEAESENNLYFSFGEPYIYEYNTLTVKSLNYNQFEQIQNYTFNCSNKIEKSIDSLVINKTNFMNYKDTYEEFVPIAKKFKDDLRLKKDEFYNLQFKDLKVDTIQTMNMFEASNYLLNEEKYLVTLNINDINIPLSISINKKEAQQITLENNTSSYWIINSVFSTLRKNYVPVFIELVFKDSIIFQSIVPEYSFEIMDNLSFSNNKYIDKFRYQEFNENFYKYHIAAGGVNNYFDYSKKFKIKRINQLGYLADFSTEQSWFLHDKLIRCCPRKSDYPDGSDGIGLYLGQYGLLLNANLPFCEGHKKFLIQESIGKELIQESNDCVQYWNKIGPFSIKREFKYEKNLQKYTKANIIINKNNIDLEKINLLDLIDNPKSIDILTYRISPNKKYFAVLINNILSVYNTTDFKNILKINLQVYFDYQLSDPFLSMRPGQKLSNRLYWDSNSNYLGYENLVFQIPFLEKFFYSQNN